MNKYGQPFPDLMDFDGDGEITWLDLNIQKELSHDPDWLDRPESKAVGVLLAILTGLFGAGAGAVGGTLGGALGGAAASAATEAATNIASGVADTLGSSEPKGDDLGPYISRDSDGDLNVKDPATGEERLYKSNGDGTYTNPLTGATYSESELKDSLNSRAENAELINQDEAARATAVAEQAEANKGVSESTKQYETEKHAEIDRLNHEIIHEEYVDDLKRQYGAVTDDELRAKIAASQTEAEIEGYEQIELEKEYKKSEKYAKNVKSGADIAIDVLAEVDKTGIGKVIKDGYAVASSAASNAGDVMAGYKTVGGAMAQTVVDSGVELLKNHSDGITEKYASNVMGESIKGMSNTYMKGGSIEEIRAEGEKSAKTGFVNATVDIAFDKAGDVVNGAMGDSGDKIVGKVLDQEITKSTLADAAGTVADDTIKNSLSDD